MPRPVEFRNRVEVVGPRLLRTNKYLPARRQVISLAQRSKPHIVGFWLVINRGCIERRPALGTKSLQTDVSAISGLSIFCRFAGQERERAWTSDNNRSQWSTAHCLAVCAVANGRRFGIGFGLERHVSAVTASINFHDRFLEFRKLEGWMGIGACCALAASGHAAAPPSAASNSRRPMVTVIRPSRARCVKGRIPRRERAVLTARHLARAPSRTVNALAALRLT